jgi:hypothetical protein
MSLTKKAGCLLVLALVPVLVSGCGKKDPQVQQQNSQLKDIYEMHKQFVKNEGKPPGALADLANPQNAPLYPGTAQALKDGKYVVVWGVSAKDSGTVLAYEKDAPHNGGSVLMADGSIKTMSAEDLKAAVPRAK